MFKGMFSSRKITSAPGFTAYAEMRRKAKAAEAAKAKAAEAAKKATQRNVIIGAVFGVIGLGVLAFALRE
jgi:hypothetical protein